MLRVVALLLAASPVHAFLPSSSFSRPAVRLSSHTTSSWRHSSAAAPVMVELPDLPELPTPKLVKAVRSPLRCRPPALATNLPRAVRAKV